MKNINTRKVVAGVAALGLSALLAGSVVAANVGNDNFSMNITKDTMYNNGVPSVSVVVGSMAQPVDVVWAGNIAAAIGKKAYVSTGVAGGAALQDVTIEVGSSSTSTVTGDGYLSDNELVIKSSSGSDEKIDLTNTDYSVLYDDDVTGNITGNSSYTIRQTETLDVNLDTFFSTRKEAQDILTFIDSGKINYKLEFSEGQGLPISDSANVDEEYFATGDTLPIKFMGGTYELQSVSSNKVTLVGSGSKTVKRTGDIIAVDNYELEVGSVTSTGDKVYLTLKENGSELASALFKVNDKVVFTGYTLDSVIKVISLDSLDNSPDFVELSIGSDGLLELESGKVLPGYGTSSNRLWRVNINADSNFLYDITVTNDRQVWNVENTSHSNSGALIEDSILLPLNLGSIDFMGLTNETTYEFVVGDNRISWVDDKNRIYEVPLYEQNIGGTSKFGFKDYYFDVNSDKYLNVHNGTTNTNTPFYSELTTADQFDANKLTLDLGNGISVLYDVYRHGNVYDLALAEQTMDFGKSDVGTWVLDLEDTNLSSTIEEDKWDYRNITNKGKVYATFTVTEDVNSGDSVDFFIDYYTQELVNKSDDWEATSTSLAYPSGQADITGMFTGQYLDQDKSDDLRHVYSEYGSYVEVDGYSGYMQIPDAKRYLQVFIGGGAESSTTLNGGELVLTTPGTVVNTEDGKVSAKLVSANVTGSASVTAMTPANWNVNNSRLVYLDNESMSGAGAKIIVGGHLVNTLANGITNEYLTQAGQYVVGATATGDVVVAGFSAQDTADAARELINAIEMLE